MKFRMHCPKCGSTTFSIERDNRSYAPRGQTFEMIFSCRCGKQMFGEQIVKEYDRQKKDWELQRDTSDREVRGPQQERLDEVRPAARAHDPRLEPDAAALVEDARRPVDEDDVDDIDEEEEEEDFDGEEGSGDSDICGWHPCSNVPRPNSKYCSRDCSNKNARWRYKQRKAAEKEAA